MTKQRKKIQVEPAIPGFDKAFTQRAYEGPLRFITDEYFRAEIVNKSGQTWSDILENAGLFALNHSGMTLSWDNIIFDHLIYDQQKSHYGDASTALDNKLRRIVDPLTITGGRTDPGFVNHWFAKTGCIAASFQNFDDLLSEKGLVAISPEGSRGLGKGYSRRYRLQKYASSFVSLGAKHRVNVYPVTVLNAEHLRPYNYSSGYLTRGARKKLKIPIAPVGMGSSSLLTGASHLTPYPAKLKYIIHRPVRFDQFVDVSQDKEEVIKQSREVAESFRRYHQGLLNEDKAGIKSIYDMNSFIQNFKASNSKRFYDPFFWHEMFQDIAGFPAYFKIICKVPLVGLPLSVWVRNKFISRNPCDQ